MSSRTAEAQEAFLAGDIDRTREAHNLPVVLLNSVRGQMLRVLLQSGSYAICLAIGVLTSAFTAGLSDSTIVFTVVCLTLISAVTAGCGLFVHAWLDANRIKHEIKREYWEFEHHPEGEVNEMIDIYMSKGFSRPDACKVMSIMANHKDFFIHHMMTQLQFISMTQELGILPKPAIRPVVRGAIGLVAFLVGGALVVIPYLVTARMNLDTTDVDPRYLSAATLSAALLFTFGCLQSHHGVIEWWQSGFFVLFIGVVSAVAGYLIGLTYVMTV